MLTGKQIAESGMLIGFDSQNIQQQGIDIRIAKISKIKKGSVGAIPINGKTTIPEYETIEPLHYRNKSMKIYGWMIPVGVYDVEFIEGVKIDNMHAMKPLTRSSLVRCGAHFESGLYDAGFETEHVGAMLYVDNPIIIEMGARVAQIVCLESDEVENPYNGQFQNDKQREVK